MHESNLCLFLSYELPGIKNHKKQFTFMKFPYETINLQQFINIILV